MTPRTPAVFERLDLLEWPFCHRLALASSTRLPLTTLRLASRLGDWPAWVALGLAQPLLHEGTTGWRLLIQFALTAVLAILVYRLLKTRLCRERPSITFRCIPCTEPPRDRYSFPSGHTMHAVMFSVLTGATAPWLLVVVAPLTGLIAVSRVGLGLHYVSDVAGGACLGMLFAGTSLWLLPMAA